MTLKQTVLAALLAPLLANTSLAQESVADLNDIVQVDLAAGWRLENGTHMAALKVALAPGWKTYWRVGGETGIAPRFDWTGSTNLGNVTYHWPRPDILWADGMQIIGYKNELVLPIEITPQADQGDISAALSVEIGVCRDVCIPVSMEVTANLAPKSDEDRFLIELAMSEGAIPGESAGLRSVSCALSEIEDGYRLNAEFTLPLRSTHPEVVVFESSQQDVWIAPATSQRSGDRLKAETSLISYAGGQFIVDPDELRVSIIGSETVVELGGCPRG